MSSNNQLIIIRKKNVEDYLNQNAKDRYEIVKIDDVFGTTLDKNFPAQKEKISLDYLDANPTGPVHLGHARSGFYGDVLANILKFYGHKISREFYVNNAKSSSQIQSLGKTALSIIGGGEGEEYRHEQLLEILKKPEVKKKLRKTKEPKEAGFYIAGLIQKENEEFLEKTVKIKFDLFFEEEMIFKSC